MTLQDKARILISEQKRSDKIANLEMIVTRNRIKLGIYEDYYGDDVGDAINEQSS